MSWLEKEKNSNTAYKSSFAFTALAVKQLHAAHKAQTVGSPTGNYSPSMKKPKLVKTVSKGDKQDHRPNAASPQSHAQSLFGEKTRNTGPLKNSVGKKQYTTLSAIMKREGSRLAPSSHASSTGKALSNMRLNEQPYANDPSLDSIESNEADQHQTHSAYDTQQAPNFPVTSMESQHHTQMKIFNTQDETILQDWQHSDSEGTPEAAKESGSSGLSQLNAVAAIQQSKKNKELTARCKLEKAIKEDQVMMPLSILAGNCDSDNDFGAENCPSPTPRGMADANAVYKSFNLNCLQKFNNSDQHPKRECNELLAFATIQQKNRTFISDRSMRLMRSTTSQVIQTVKPTQGSSIQLTRQYETFTSKSSSIERLDPRVLKKASFLQKKTIAHATTKQSKAVNYKPQHDRTDSNLSPDAHLSPERTVPSSNMSHLVLDQQVANTKQAYQSTLQDTQIFKSKISTGKMSLMPPKKIKEQLKQLKASESGALPASHSKLFPKKKVSQNKLNSTSQTKLIVPTFTKISSPQTQTEEPQKLHRQPSAEPAGSALSKLFKPLLSRSPPRVRVENKFPNKHLLQKTIPNFRNNMPKQLTNTRQKLSSRASERTGRVSNPESAAENQRISIQPDYQYKLWLAEDDISQQGSEDARVAIARQKEPPVKPNSPSKQLFQQQLSPKSSNSNKGQHHRVSFSPSGTAQNRRTFVMTKQATGDCQKMTKRIESTEGNDDAIQRNLGMTSHERLDVSYGGIKVRKSCPVIEKEELESPPRCIFRQPDKDSKHDHSNDAQNPFTPAHDMDATQRLMVEEETNCIPVEYTRRQTFARIPQTQIKQQPSTCFSGRKVKQADSIRECRSLEGFTRKRPQIPPDEENVYGSFLIISPQTSENQKYNYQNKISIEGIKMEKRKVVGTYQQRREDPLDKIWNEISKPDKTADRKEVPNYHIKQQQPRRKPNPFADPFDNSLHSATFHPPPNDVKGMAEPQSPLTPNQPVSLIHASNEVMSSNIHVEGQVLDIPQTDTPAEKAKRRVSMADRMIEPQSKRIAPSPSKLKNSKKTENLKRLENDVLNLNQNPGNSARRMTMPQVLKQDNFTNRLTQQLTVAAAQRSSERGSAQRGTYMNLPPQQPTVDRDISPRVHVDDTINNPEQKQEEEEEPKSGIVNMVSKALGNFFNRQSDVNRESNTDKNENVDAEWPPKPERTPIKENSIIKLSQYSSEELVIECEKCSAKIPQSKIDLHEQGCIMLECRYCKKSISSTMIDDHEYKCSEDLSMSAKKKIMGMPETKVTSQSNAVISKVESSEDLGDVGSSNEQTPERNQIVHEQKINDRKERRPDKETKSPIEVQNETKIRMIAAKRPTNAQPQQTQLSSAALDSLASETLQREKKLQEARKSRMNLEKSVRKNKSVRPRLQGATTESSLHLSRRNTQMIKLPTAMKKQGSNNLAVLVSPSDIKKPPTSSKKEPEEYPQEAQKERGGSFLGGIFDNWRLPSNEEIVEKPVAQTSREDNNKSAPKNQTLNTLTSSTSKKESPAITKTQSGILKSRTDQKDPQSSLPKKVPPLLQKGQSLQIDSDLKTASPLKRSPLDTLGVTHKSPPQTKNKLSAIASGRRATQVYGNMQHLQRKEMPNSGQSMSTNDQSNPSPNMGMGSNQQMKNRTQILKGLLPNEAMEKYEDELTPFEKSELSTYEQIYTIGSFRVNGLKQIADREGFYKAKIGEQIGYRYIVDQNIDAGAFGQVIKAIDMKDGGREVALKLSKNKKQETDNAQVEAKLLKKILGKDPDKYCIVKMLDSFYFRKHFVIVFELLDTNLYKYIKEPSFTGMKKDHLREIATQMLYGLAHLSKIKIIHCDLKPENVVFTDQTRQAVKIIDFGSACTEFKQGFVYVQSRFYRSPEVVLGLPYDQAVDMWSFGCILAELVTGRPLFPAIDEKELLEWILIRIGHIPEHMIKNCTKRRQFYDANFRLIRSARSRIPRGSQPQCDSIRNALYSEDDDEFIDFIEKCLIVDPALRLTPEKGLKHNWIKRSKVQSMFKENALVSNHILKDLEDVMKPLPSNKRERYQHNTKLQLLKQESGRVSGPGNAVQPPGSQAEEAKATSGSQGQTNALSKTQAASDIHNNKS